MVAIKKHAPADATAESLELLTGKVDAMDRRLTAGFVAVSQSVTALERGQASLQSDVTALKQGQASLERGQVSLKQGQTALERGQEILMENQLRMQAQLDQVQTKLDLLVTHLVKPGK